MRYLVASEIYRGIHTSLIDPEVVSFETSTLAKRYAMQLGAEVGTFARSAVEPVRENDVTVGINKHGRMLTSGARTRLRQGDALLDADSDVLLVHRSYRAGDVKEVSSAGGEDRTPAVARCKRAALPLSYACGGTSENQRR